MDVKRLFKALLLPHLALMIVLVPISTVFLIYSMAFVGTESVVAVISYVLAAYTLTVWCVRLPSLVRSIKTFKNENRYAQMWFDDARLRVNVSLYGGFLWNVAYAIFLLCLGLYHLSFWYCSVAGYYITLAFVRFSLVRYTGKRQPCEDMATELKKYRACGYTFLVMNLALTLIIFFMVYWDRSFEHHQITAIAMAAYTFTALAAAIVNIVKYHRLGSPVYSASRMVGLAAACVSMLTLESTMLTAFGDGSIDMVTRRLMLGVSGGCISLFLLVMAVYMIVSGTKRLQAWRGR